MNNWVTGEIRLAYAYGRVISSHGLTGGLALQRSHKLEIGLVERLPVGLAGSIGNCGNLGNLPGGQVTTSRRLVCHHIPARAGPPIPIFVLSDGALRWPWARRNGVVRVVTPDPRRIRICRGLFVGRTHTDGPSRASLPSSEGISILFGRAAVNLSRELRRFEPFTRHTCQNSPVTS